MDVLLQVQSTNIFLKCLIFAALLNAVKTLNPTSVLVVIVTQRNTHHIKYAQLSSRNLQEQAFSIRSEAQIEILLSGETWPDIFDQWTIINLLDEVDDLYSDDYSWLLVIRDHTEVSLPNLISLVSHLEPKQPHFIGRAMKDEKHCIIHHYAEPGSLLFPDFSAGVLLSFSAFHGKELVKPHAFSIDAQYELAQALKDVVRLQNSSKFCTPGHYNEECATYYTTQSLICAAGSLHKAVSENDIFVLVKTGEKFHKDRVPLQQRLWTKRVKNLEICSEKADFSIPTVGLPTVNTERGHCAKFLAILQRAYRESHINSKDWVVIVDDDTIMNVTRLTHLLACYNPDESIAVGERYCYGSETKCSYDYLTGGAGAVFSRTAVKQIISSGFMCGSPESPDDMAIGAWLQRIGIPVLHSPLFHQATPNAYAPDYLNPQLETSISFHKYIDGNPELIARDYLGIEGITESAQHTHEEL